MQSLYLREWQLNETFIIPLMESKRHLKKREWEDILSCGRLVLQIELFCGQI